MEEVGESEEEVGESEEELEFYRHDIIPLGHLHAGNIFVEDVGESKEEASCGEIPEEDTPAGASAGASPFIVVIDAGSEGHEEAGRKVCRVGGYENMLLGYWTKLHRDLLKSKVNTNLIDIYLFGKF